MTLDEAQQLEILTRGEVVGAGVIPSASNVAVRVVLELDGVRLEAVHKPTAGERPLRDFPHGSLAAREAAAWAVARAGGWDVVPPTVRREGPWGPGSFQAWVDGDDSGEDVLLAIPAAELDESTLEGVLPVLAGEDEEGEQVVVAHPDEAGLREIALLDAVLDNADRKASHVIRTPEGRLVAIDHGLCLHAEPKLRTVLWGWAGDPLTEAELARLVLLEDALGSTTGHVGDPLLREALAPLATSEVEALRLRTRLLREGGAMPLPDPERYVLPWPLW